MSQRVEDINAKLDRLQQVIDASGLGLLAELQARRLVEENMALVLSPEVLRGLSFFGQALDETPSLVQALRVLKSLDDAGALEFSRMIAGAVPDALSAVLEPTNLRILGNLAVALQFLTTVDPTIVAAVVEAVSGEVGKVLTPANLASPPRVGLTGLLGALRDPDVQAGLGLAMLLVAALGRAARRVAARQQVSG